MVWPDTRGGPSAVTCLRMFDHNPSAPIRSRPGDAFAVRKPRRHRRAVLVVADNFAADAQLDQFMGLGSARRNTPCRSPRCTTA